MPGDSLHLTNESAEIMANYINKAINDQLNQSIGSEDIEVTIEASDSEMLALDKDLETKEIRTAKQTAAKLIGAGGERIRRIKTLYNVEIHTKQTDEDQQVFVIKGNPSYTAKAYKTIKAIVSDIEEKDNEKQTKVKYANTPEKQQKNTNDLLVLRKRRVQQRKNVQIPPPRGANLPKESAISPDNETDTETTSDGENREPTPIRKVTLKKRTVEKKRKPEANSDPNHPKRPSRSNNQEWLMMAVKAAQRTGGNP